MNWSDVAEFEELSEPKFIHHADGADMFYGTSVGFSLVVRFVGVGWGGGYCLF